MSESIADVKFWFSSSPKKLGTRKSELNLLLWYHSLFMYFEISIFGEKKLPVEKIILKIIEKTQSFYGLIIDLKNTHI